MHSLFLSVTLIQALFPDNTYGVDSGGDPRVIPNLTFEEFKVCFETNVKLLLWYIEITNLTATYVWLLVVCVH